MHKIPLFFLLITMPLKGISQLSDRIANYDISVKLDPEKKVLYGKEALTWTNPSAEPLDELQFHLYLNAFRDKNSTFMKESGGQLRSDKMDKEKGTFGRTDIISMNVRGGENLLYKIKYIQPDDFNREDKTVISVRLAKPLKPGETIVIDISFKAVLPRVFARTGWAPDDYFLVGQWFPKIGVYETPGVRRAKKGQWNCHQFHAHTEFYADFGTYDVKINLPPKFIVAATGQLKQEKKEKDGTITYNFIAKDVHDFAWTTSPHFKVSERYWKGVKLRAVMQPEHESQSERYFESVIYALQYFEKLMGKYPHPVLTMVDPPTTGSGSGGMEYPMFITCGSVWGIGKWGKFAETVTIHEFGHQYLQGIIASNEFEESWMDEGFNQYVQGRIMDEYYPDGAEINLFGFKINDVAASRMSYVAMSNPGISEIYRNAWEYPKGTYGVLTYQKTATWMLTLDRLIGRKVMDEVLKTYYTRWKFKHPDAYSFIDIVNEIVPGRTAYKYGKDMNWFFDQVLFRAAACDYILKGIENKETGSLVSVNRNGEMIMPTELVVTFENGNVQMIQWDGKERNKSFRFKERVVSASLDPEKKNLLDLNFINNSKSVNDDTVPAFKYSVKVLFWVQNCLHFFADFF